MPIGREPVPLKKGNQPAIMARRARPLIPLLVVAMAAGGLVANPPSGAEAQVTSAATGSQSVGTLRLGGDIGSVKEPSRYQYVILNAWEYDQIAPIKAANPNAKVLVYKDISSTRSYAVKDGVDDALLPAGVGWADADANHPEWFVKLDDGSRFEWAPYPGHWQMDVSNRSYQDTWLNNVSAELSAKGWDGVMMDNTLGSLRYYIPSGRSIPAFPTDDAVLGAYENLLSRVGPALTQKGLLVLPNISDVSHERWGKWMSYTSGALQEYFSKYGEGAGGYLTGDEWTWRMKWQEVTEEAKRIYIGITYAPQSDVRAMRYARASFLLYWNGGSSALIYHPGKGIDATSDEWMLDIGTPVGGRYAVGVGWRRDYTGGTVLVNPSPTSSLTVPLTGSYLLPDGTLTSSATLSPGTGLVLRQPPVLTTTTTTTAPTTTTTAPTTTTTVAPTTTTLAPGPTAPGAGTYEEDSTAITYTGTWTRTTYSGDSGGASSYARPSAAAELRFSGTAVRWVGRRQSYFGIADVFIDGTKAVSVDTYSPSLQANQVLFERTGLAAGDHTIRIVPTGAKNAFSTGTIQRLDAFVVPAASVARSTPK